MLDGRVIKNIFYLLIVQGANYVLPLLIVPFLIGKMGVKNYGTLAIVQSILAFSLVLIDYGFVFIGPKKVAEDRDEKRYLSIFLTVTICRLILSLIVIVTLAFYAFFILSELIVIKMILAGCAHLLFQAIYAPWFFQGLQRMGYITTFSLLGRLLSLIPCFVFIHSYDDAPLFFYFLALGSFTQAIFTVYLVLKMVKVEKIQVLILEYFKEGFLIFFSRIFVNVYTTAIPTIIGFSFGQYQAGVYSAIDKVVRGVSSLQGPFIQALYPFIIRGKNGVDKESLRIYSIPCFCYLLFIIFIFYFGGYILELLNVPVTDESLFIFNILSWLPLLLSISGFLGVCKLLANNKNKEFSISIIFSSLAFLVCVFIVIHFFGFSFFAFASIFAELVAISSMSFFLIDFKKYKQQRSKVI